MELLAQPKRTRGKSSSKTPLKALGNHPTDNEPINVYEGPYGIYVNHLKVNAGLPEGETVETITLEKALELLAEKAGSKATKKKTTTKKTTTKKTTTRKTKSSS